MYKNIARILTAIFSICSLEFAICNETDSAGVEADQDTETTEAEETENTDSAEEKEDEKSPEVKENKTNGKEDSTTAKGNHEDSEVKKQATAENDIDNSPFKPTEESVSNETVVGIRLIGEDSEKKEAQQKDTPENKGTKNIQVCLLSKDYKSVVSEKSAEDVFNDMNFFNQYPNLCSVEIAKVEFDNSLCESLQKFLPHELKSLIIDSCTIVDGIDNLATLLNGHTELQALMIRAYDISGEEVNKLLTSIAQHKGLTQLNLGVESFDDAGLKQLSEIICELQLKRLALSWQESVANSESYTAFCDALQKASTITCLDISAMEISQESLNGLLSSLGELSQLTDLQLFVGNLDEHGSVAAYKSAEILGNSLKNLSNLTHFNIADSSWSAEPLCLIFQTLSPNALQFLDVSGNKFDVKSATALSNFIKQATKLKTLFVNSCDMTDNEYSALCGGLSGSSLAYMYAAGNKIENSASSMPISSMPNIVLYDISNNETTYENALSIVQQANGHKKIRLINLSNNSKIDSASSQDKGNYRKEIGKINLQNSNLVVFGI